MLSALCPIFPRPWLAAAALLAAPWPLPAAILLVEHGVARADVIVATNATGDERAAAGELVRCIRKATGAALPVRDERRPGRAAVLVGLSVAPPALRAQAEALGGDGYLVHAAGDTVVLAGRGREGTSFATYEFLERALDARWLWPGELGEIVPARPTLAVGDLALTREPAFHWRWLGPGGALWGHHDRWSKERDLGISAEHQAAMRRWEKRNRFGGENIYGGHAFGEILPPAVYGPTHPEYYALVRGERDWRNFNGKHRCQPCTSNPEVVQKTIEYCLRMFATQPDLDGVSIALNDGRGFCECEPCTRLDTGRTRAEAADPELGRGGEMRIITDRLILFGNAVAAGVTERMPGKKVLFYGYSQFREPPERVRAHPNLLVAYTLHAHDLGDEEVRHATFAELAGWAGAAPAFGVYEYFTQTNFPDMPRLVPELIQLELRELRRLGSRYFHTQAGNGFAVNGLNFYVLGRLLWDPEADVAALRAEYCRHAFGPAAAAMARYHDRFIAGWRGKPSASVKMNTFSVSDYTAVLGTYPRELRDACRGDLDEALALATGEPRRRVEFVRAGFDYFDLTMRAAEASFPLLQAGWRPTDGSAGGGKAEPARLRAALDLWRERERLIERHREDFVLSYLWIKSGDETRTFNPLKRVRQAEADR